MRHWLFDAGRRLGVSALIILMIGLLLPTASFGLNAFHPVTFMENDSPSDTVSTYLTLNTPADLTLFSALSPAFSNPGHSFVGWNTSSTGVGTSYVDGALYSFAADLVLYAQWSMNVTPPPTTTTTTGVPTTTTTLVTTTTVNSGSSYVVTVSGGSGSGSGSPITSVPGLSIHLPLSDGLSKAGYVFSGWYSAASGGVFLGLAGASFTPTSSVSIYAQWTIAPTVKLHFSSNHGGGSVADVNGLEGATISLPSAKTLAYPRYQFTGWNTKSDASGISYAAGAKFVLSSTMTLFALWAPQRLSQGHSLLIGAIGPFAEGSSHLTGALKLQIRGIAVAIKSSGYAAASLYGYATGSGSASTNQQLSTNRALAVVGFLRSDLAAIHSKSVSTNAAGEGAIAGSTGAMFRRVEIFVR